MQHTLIMQLLRTSNSEHNDSVSCMSGWTADPQEGSGELNIICRAHVVLSETLSETQKTLPFVQDLSIRSYADCRTSVGGFVGM